MDTTRNILGTLKPLTVIVGHYGVGKTNLSLNLAIDLAAQGAHVQLVDLDVVNPYFRSSDYQELLTGKNVKVIAPNFAGTTLDNPSISGRVSVAIGEAVPPAHVIIDAGGDDVGATALGRFAPEIRMRPHDMFYVVNAYRNITQDIDEAVMILREIEHKSGLTATGIINNSHLQNETTARTVYDSVAFARAIASRVKLPLMFTTAPNTVAGTDNVLESVENVYPVKRYVRTSWDA